MEAREELRKLRESTGMNRKEFCEYFEIPYMTETDWELGNRRVPQYLLRLMAYKVEMEKSRAMNQQIDNVLVIVQQPVAQFVGGRVYRGQKVQN